MTRILSLLVVLALSPFAAADYYKLYTQVQVNSQIGNIVVSRGVAREPKYVDYMTDHREEMAKDNIFPDADLATFVKNTVSAEMDGQKIEVIVHSDHRRMHGAGCAVADNYIEIRIDGKRIYESTFGDYRVQSEVYKIILLPLKNALFVYGHDSDLDANDYPWPSAFWYDELEEDEYIYLLEPGTSWMRKSSDSAIKPSTLKDPSVPCQDLCCNTELIAKCLEKLKEEKQGESD